MVDTKIVLTVLEYLPEPDMHLCLDAAGNLHRVDLLVDGGLGKFPHPADLAGRVVSCEQLFVHSELASEVRFVEAAEAEKGEDDE